MTLPTLQAGRCFVIGEVGLAHDGSLGYAHAFIDEVARAGADAVKFQTHIAEAESTPSEPFRVAFSRQDASRYDYWKRMEFTESQWRELASHASERGLVFLSSPFSVEAVELLTRVGMAMWKVPSGEIGSVALLDAMISTGRPVLLSSGMSDLRELDAAVERVRRAGLPLAVLQCTTAYPVSSRTRRVEHDFALPRPLQLLRRPVGSFGNNLSRHRCSGHRCRRRGSARHDEPRHVWSRRAGVDHHGAATRARRRHPLRRAHACAPG